MVGVDVCWRGAVVARRKVKSGAVWCLRKGLAGAVGFGGAATGTCSFTPELPSLQSRPRQSWSSSVEDIVSWTSLLGVDTCLSRKRVSRVMGLSSSDGTLLWIRQASGRG